MRSRIWPVWLVAVSLLGAALPAQAQQAPLSERASPPIRKLSRGLANAMTGVLEIPLTIQAVNVEKGPVAGLSLGLFVGLGAAITRTAVGIVEVVTFLFPMPQGGYEPLIEPEFLLQPGTFGTGWEAS